MATFFVLFKLSWKINIYTNNVTKSIPTKLNIKLQVQKIKSKTNLISTSKTVHNEVVFFQVALNVAFVKSYHYALQIHMYSSTMFRHSHPKQIITED